MAIERRHKGPRMSQIVVHGNTVYFAGLVGDDRDADMATQTQQILDKIDRYLAEVGTDKSKLLAAEIWINDMSKFDEMNAVWDAWIDPDNPPGRACCEAKLAHPDWKVEIIIRAAC
ncbi:MAG: RidA family protein [Alphaproteobacteria bacterium]|jgi:enamine deaminase RidA (YjgF/YER057c/UK114 family)|nr:RidA family protein [Alphaproteobacteria bacterium]